MTNKAIPSTPRRGRTRSEKAREATGTQKATTSTASDLPTAPAVEKDSGGDVVEDDLTEAFPGYRALSEAGITKRSEVEAMSDDELQGTKGIGPKTAADIREALKK